MTNDRSYEESEAQPKSLPREKNRSRTDKPRTVPGPSGTTAPDAKLLKSGGNTGRADRVDTFIRGLNLVLSHHGAPSKVIASFKKQAQTYLDVQDEGLFLKRAKYLILQPMARFLGNESPDVPDLDFEPSGRWRRWSRARLEKFSNKNVHLWYSFLQGKRAAAPVSKEIVLANFQKHRDQMLAPDPLLGLEGEGELLDEMMTNLWPILRRLSNMLAADLAVFFLNPGEEVHKASESASFESSRKTGGQAGAIRQLVQPGLFREREELERMVVRDDITRKGRKTKAGNVVTTTVRSAELSRLEDAIYSEIDKYESIERLDAKVEAVIEPFKVRTISKGPALPYYIAKPVQKAVHTRMRKMDPFRLIGRPFDPTDLMDLVEAQKRIAFDDRHHWLSIDYSAATDGLSALLSSEIMQNLLGALAPWNLKLYNLLLSVLAPHRVHYPKVGTTQLESVDQQNGQLMGSVLSFPVLCLANLGLYLTVRKRLNPSASMKDLLSAVLINGDDMLYIGTEEEWDLHKQLGEQVGLKMSPGKAYIHKKYANINSVSTVYDLSNSRATPKIIPFLNVGLMVGNHKVMARVGDGDEETRSSPYISVINEVVRGALPSKQADIFKGYIAMHKADIRQEAKGRNLFLPISLGGFGVKMPDGIRTTYTPRQLSLAAWNMRKYGYYMPDIRPWPPGRAVEEVMDLEVDPVFVSPESDEFRLRFFKEQALHTPDMLNFPWIEFIIYRENSALVLQTTESNRSDAEALLL